MYNCKDCEWTNQRTDSFRCYRHSTKGIIRQILRPIFHWLGIVTF
jgi:hypothetical protein